MANRIFSIVGWLGTALVFAAPGDPLRLPGAGSSTRYYLAWGGLVCMLLYMLPASGARSRRSSRAGRRATARWRRRACSSSLGILVAINYIGKRQNKRWDLTAAKQFSLSDQSRNVLAKLDAPLEIHGLRRRSTEFQRFRDRLKEYEYASKQVTTEYIDPDKKPTVAQQNQVQQYGTIVFNYKGRTERVTTEHRAGHHQRHHQGRHRRAAEGLLHAGTRREGHDVGRARRLQRDRATRSGARTTPSRSSSSRSRASVPDDASVVVVAGPQIDFFPPEVDALKKYLDKGGQAAAGARSAGQGGQPGADQPDRARPRLGRRASATTSSSTSAAWGS